MFVHVFAFRWATGVTEEQKMRVEEAILALQGTIPGLIETSVGNNLSPRGHGYEFGGVMKLTDKAAMVAYETHPLHQELLGWLLPLVEPFELDFEI